ncbi:MAG: hypothetical protein M3143_09580 [Actinomycetota bacterium]|nr:hypothetical protein [Actinomycetota bacterium]
MWRFTLSRRWWAGHVLVILCCAVFIWLGRWQWGRAESPTGDWQNLGYALQWPLFAAVLVAAWTRFLWLEQHRGPGPAPAPNVAQPDNGRSTRHPGPRPIPEDDPDDELAAYNTYLARLAEQDRRS